MASPWLSTSSNVTEEEHEQYIEALQADTTRMMIPAMTFLILLAVVGVVGNSLVLIVYSRNFQQTSTRIFIMAIAAFDLVTNVLAIPGEIYDMLHRWNFNQPHLCGFRLTLNAFTIVTSAFLLVAVAVVRYKKVCRPHGKQTTIRSAKYTTLVIVLASIVVAIPCAILNGRQTKKTRRDDIKGHACTIDDRYVGTIWPRTYMGTFIVGFLGCCTCLIVLYTLIGIQAWRHSNVNRVVYNTKLSAPSSTFQTTSDATGLYSENKSTNNITVIKLSSLFGWRRQKDVQMSELHTNQENMAGTHEETESTPVPFTDTDIMVNDDIEEESNCLDTHCDVRIQSQSGGESSRDTVSFRLLTDKTDSHYVNSNSEIQIRGCSDQHDVVCESWVHSTSPRDEKADRELFETDFKPDTEIKMGDKEDHATLGCHKPDIKILSDEKEGDSKVDVLSSMGDQFSNLRNVLGATSSAEENFNNEKLCGDRFKSRKTVDFLISESKQKKMKEFLFHRKTSSFDNDSRREQNTSKHRRPMTRTTIMLIAISAVYVIGFVPHLSLVFFRYSSPRIFGGMTFAGFSVYNLFLRFHFLNSASNAIIYSLCDKKFRQHARRILKCVRR